jgi:hypothetical protein
MESRFLRKPQLEKEGCHLLADQEGSEDGLYVHHLEPPRQSTRSPHASSAKFIYLLILLLTNLVSITSTYWYSDSYNRRAFSPDFAGSIYFQESPETIDYRR